MKINLGKSGFNGIQPKSDPKLLPDGFAQTAENCQLLAGNLRPINEPTAVEATTDASIGTMYDYYQDKYVMTLGASGSLATMQAVTNGAFNIGIGGNSVKINGLNFSTCATLAACAALLQTKIRAADGGDISMTVTHDGTAFVFSSGFELSALTEYTGSTGNYWGTGADGTNQTLGATSYTATEDGDVIVKQYAGTLTITGAVTTANRCKGLAIYVNGDLVVKSGGSISMTARGAKAAAPSNDIVIARLSNAGQSLDFGSIIPSAAGTALATTEANAPNSTVGTGKKYIIQANGGAGGIQATLTRGANGAYLQTGGGGFGRYSPWGTANLNPQAAACNGTAGTCWGGGTGGATYGDRSKLGANIVAAVAAGGAGGGNIYGAAGAGNPAGTGSSESYATAAVSGTGGLLMLFVRGNITVEAGGSITAIGSRGGYLHFSDGAWEYGGGSGGGIILGLHGGTYTNAGTVTTVGGEEQAGSGSVVFEQVDAS